jgi:hypothetical protein
MSRLIKPFDNGGRATSTSLTAMGDGGGDSGCNELVLRAEITYPVQDSAARMIFSACDFWDDLFNMEPKLAMIDWWF